MAKIQQRGKKQIENEAKEILGISKALEYHMDDISDIERKLKINDIIEACIGMIGVLLSLIENDLFYQVKNGKDILVPWNKYENTSSSFNQTYWNYAADAIQRQTGSEVIEAGDNLYFYISTIIKNRYEQTDGTIALRFIIGFFTMILIFFSFRHAMLKYQLFVKQGKNIF